MRIVSLSFVLVLAIGCSRKPAGVAVDTSAGSETPSTANRPDPVEAALLTIRSGSPERRLDAISRLLSKADDERIVPALLETLQDSTSSAAGVSRPGTPHSAREAAVMALMRIGGDAKAQLISSGLKPLIEGLKDPKPAVREHTALALGLMLKEAAPAIDGLVALCGEVSSPVRTAAYDSLRVIGPIPVEPILKLLASPQPGVAVDAAVALASLTPKGAPALKLLVEILKDVPAAEEKPEVEIVVRNAAALAIGRMGAAGAEAIPELVDMVKKTTEEDLLKVGRLSDMGAITALRRIGKPSVPALIPLLADPEPFVRYQAVVLLGLIGPDAAEALPQVVGLVETEMKELEVVTAAALAVVQMGGDASKPVARLTALLADERPSIQLAVARVLRGLGRAAGDAPVEPLILILKRLETDEKVRVQVIGALRALGPVSKPAIPVLVEQLLESEDGEVRKQLLQSLGQFGPLAVAAVPALKKLLDDEDLDIREAAMLTASAIGPTAKDLAPELLRMLKAPSANPRSRLPIFAALTAIRADSPTAVPILMELVTERDPEHLRATIEALGRCGGEVPAVRDKLLAMSQRDSRMDVRLASIRAMAGMKSASFGEVFRTILSGKNVDMQPWAHAGLHLISAERPGIAPLDAMLRDRTPAAAYVRLQAIDAAAILGQGATPLLPALAEALKDATPISAQDKNGVQVRDRALQTIGILGASAAPIVIDLDRLMRDSTGDFRRRVIVTVGLIGPAAKALEPRLREMIRLDPELATEAREAIDRIGR